MVHWPYSPQNDRVCDECGKRFLSGIAHIERATVQAMICVDCAEQGLYLGRFRHLTAMKKAEARQKARKNA